MFGIFVGDRSVRPQKDSLFADSVRTTLDSAREEAARLGHEYVGTEHFLLALCLPGTRGNAQLLALGANPSLLRGRVETVCKRGHSTRGTNLPYTGRAKKMFELTMEAVRPIVSRTQGRSGAPPIEVEYLLLGLLLEGKGVAAQLLAEIGITIEAVRQTLDAPKFAVQLSDTSDASITDQIVTQVAEAIATAVLKPGERLPTVRHLADSLDIAPGTVARAYSELERQGVVVTDGARGTTVAHRAPPPATSGARVQALAALLRPVAVEAFHRGATAQELREAMEQAIDGVKFEGPA